jgi:hypothetical protein
MIRRILPLAFIFSFLIIYESSGREPVNSLIPVFAKNDTITENQVLYNGRIWRNQYLNLENDQFLFTRDLLPGSVSISGKSFSGIFLRYDIFNDEIITPADIPGMVQINKEMVDSFSLRFENKTYRFSKITEDTLPNLRGYVNVLYKGRSALYMRYIKELYHMSGQSVNDKFFQKSQLYFVKNKAVFPINSKRDLFNIFSNEKTQIKEFIKKNNIGVSKRDPESFVPVVKYIDSLIQ